jgi:WD40 repeat protein
MSRRLQFWFIILIIAASNMRTVFAQDFTSEILGQPSENLSIYFPLPDLQPITIDNASHLKPLGFIYPTIDWVSAVAFSPDQKLLAFSTWHSIELWDTTTGKSFGKMQSEAVVRDLAFNRDGTLLAVATDNGIKLLNTISLAQTGTPDSSDYPSLNEGQGRSSGILSVVFNSEGNILISVGADGVIRFWDAHDEPEQFGRQIDEVTMPFYDSMNTSLALGGNVLIYRDDHTLTAWNLNVTSSESNEIQVDLIELYSISNFSSNIGSVAFSADNLLLAAVSRHPHDNQLLFLDAAKGRTLPYPREGIQQEDYGALAFNPDASLLFASTDSQTYGFEVLDRETGKSVQTGLPDVSSITVNSTGTLVVTGHASAGWGGALVLWGIPIQQTRT